MKILVIGCGSIGKRHAENAKQLADTGVFDTDSGKTLAVASELNLKSFATLESALQWKPTIAIVAAPTHLHIEIAQKAVQGGAHVLIEKPISNSIDGVQEFLKEAAVFNRKVSVVCNMRFHPAIEKIKQNLEQIGSPLFARAYYGNYLPNMRTETPYQNLYCARRSMGGGVILDAIHEIDYLMWFFGPVKKVTGVTAKLSDLEIDVEDYAAVVLEHQNGVRSEIHLDYLQRCKRRGLEIIGEEGSILWQSTGKVPEDCRVELFSSVAESWEMIMQDRNLSYVNMYAHMLKAVIDSVHDNHSDELILSGQEAAQELFVALSALKSAEKNQTIRIGE